MDEADIALVVEAMYQVAADPGSWEQLIAVLGDQPPRDEAPAAAIRGLAHSAEIARMVRSADDAAAAPAPRASRVGWVLLSARGKVTAANLAAEGIMAGGLGRLRKGSELQFDDLSNTEALVRALAQAKNATAGQVILKLDRDGDEGPYFAYVALAKALPAEVFSDLSVSAIDPAGYALIFPAVEETRKLWMSIRESFGLTPAEMRLAAKLREGKTLKEAAEEMSVSINTVRNQLRAVFDKMGLKRQSDLVRALGDLAQVAGAMEVEAPIPGPGLPATPEVGKVVLRDGRHLAYREYGVPHGRALLVFHEGLGSSLLPPGAQALATELSLRVISAERPGFGQSDPSPDYSFDGVADDMVELCDQLGLQRVRITAVLSGAASAIQTALRLGKRAEGLLLCSGRPPRPTTRVNTLMNAFRARLETNPWVIETLYAILRVRMSLGMTERMIRSSTSQSSGDRALLDETPWLLDYVVAYVSECLAKTSKGAAEEIRAFRRSGNLTPAGLACPLTIWHGEDDQFAPLSDLMEYLGDTPCEVTIFPQMGHLLGLKVWDRMMRWAAS